MGLSYILVVAGIILAKGLGFFRNIFFSGIFADSVQAAAYFQVFNIVNLIFAGVGVALSTLVIKNINKPENLGNEKAYVASFLRKSVLAVTGVAVLISLLAKPIVKYILLPGLNPELKEIGIPLATKLMYIMAPSLIFVVVAYIISGVLQNEKVFFITSIMSLPFNVIIIASLFVPNINIYIVSIATTIGWLFQALILLPFFYKKGYRFTKSYKPTLFKNKNPEILWVFISNMLYQLIFFADRIFINSVPIFNYATDLFVIIASIFVVAMSTVFFPSISKNYEEGNIDYVNGILQYIISVMSAIFLPFLLVIGVFGRDIIRILYERDDFGPQTTQAVATILFVYSLGILGYVAQELFNKFLYIAGKYKVCVIGTIGVILVNIVSNSILSKFLPATQFYGSGVSTKEFFVAASSAFLLLVYACIVAFSIKNVVGNYLSKPLITDLFKIFVSGACAFVVYLVFNNFAPTFTHGRLTFIIPICACGVVYIVALLLTGVLSKLIKKKGTKRNEEN